MRGARASFQSRRVAGKPGRARRVVIAGHANAVARAGELAKARRQTGDPSRRSAHFHCALMKPTGSPGAAPSLPSRSRVPIVTNVDAGPKTKAADGVEALIRQVSLPVRWEDVVKRLVAEVRERSSSSVPAACWLV